MKKQWGKRALALILAGTMAFSQAGISAIAEGLDAEVGILLNNEETEETSDVIEVGVSEAEEDMSEAETVVLQEETTEAEPVVLEEESEQETTEAETEELELVTETAETELDAKDAMMANNPAEIVEDQPTQVYMPGKGTGIKMKFVPQHSGQYMIYADSNGGPYFEWYNAEEYIPGYREYDEYIGRNVYPCEVEAGKTYYIMCVRNNPGYNVLVVASPKLVEPQLQVHIDETSCPKEKLDGLKIKFNLDGKVYTGTYINESVVFEAEESSASSVRNGHHKFQGAWVYSNDELNIIEWTSYDEYMGGRDVIVDGQGTICDAATRTPLNLEFRYRSYVNKAKVKVQIDKESAEKLNEGQKINIWLGAMNGQVEVSAEMQNGGTFDVEVFANDNSSAGSDGWAVNTGDIYASAYISTNGTKDNDWNNPVGYGLSVNEQGFVVDASGEPYVMRLEYVKDKTWTAKIQFVWMNTDVTPTQDQPKMVKLSVYNDQGNVVSTIDVEFTEKTSFCEIPNIPAYTDIYFWDETEDYEIGYENDDDVLDYLNRDKTFVIYVKSGAPLYQEEDVCRIAVTKQVAVKGSKLPEGKVTFDIICEGISGTHKGDIYTQPVTFDFTGYKAGDSIPSQTVYFNIPVKAMFTQQYPWDMPTIVEADNTVYRIRETAVDDWHYSFLDGDTVTLDAVELFNMYYNNVTGVISAPEVHRVINMQNIYQADVKLPDYVIQKNAWPVDCSIAVARFDSLPEADYTEWWNKDTSQVEASVILNGVSDDGAMVNLYDDIYFTRDDYKQKKSLQFADVPCGIYVLRTEFQPFDNDIVCTQDVVMENVRVTEKGVFYDQGTVPVFTCLLSNDDENVPTRNVVFPVYLKGKVDTDTIVYVYLTINGDPSLLGDYKSVTFKKDENDPYGVVEFENVPTGIYGIGTYIASGDMNLTGGISDDDMHALIADANGVRVVHMSSDGKIVPIAPYSITFDNRKLDVNFNVQALTGKYYEDEYEKTQKEWEETYGLKCQFALSSYEDDVNATPIDISDEISVMPGGDKNSVKMHAPVGNYWLIEKVLMPDREANETTWYLDGWYWSAADAPVLVHVSEDGTVTFDGQNSDYTVELERNPDGNSMAEKTNIGFYCRVEGDIDAENPLIVDLQLHYELKELPQNMQMAGPSGNLEVNPSEPNANGQTVTITAKEQGQVYVEFTDVPNSNDYKFNFNALLSDAQRAEGWTCNLDDASREFTIMGRKGYLVDGAGNSIETLEGKPLIILKKSSPKVSFTKAIKALDGGELPTGDTTFTFKLAGYRDRKDTDASPADAYIERDAKITLNAANPSGIVSFDDVPAGVYTLAHLNIPADWESDLKGKEGIVVKVYEDGTVTFGGAEEFTVTSTYQVVKTPETEPEKDPEKDPEKKPGKKPSKKGSKSDNTTETVQEGGAPHTADTTPLEMYLIMLMAAAVVVTAKRRQRHS